jgi:hypothetical protein
MSFFRRALAAVVPTPDCPDVVVTPGAGGIVDAGGQVPGGQVPGGQVPVPAGRATLEDPGGVEWQAETDRRWQAATSLGAFVPVPLPAWSAPWFVAREVLGRFLVDTGAGRLHDVANATEACAIDAIATGQWIHFAHELEVNVAADVADCPHCIAEA